MMVWELDSPRTYDQRKFLRRTQSLRHLTYLTIAPWNVNLRELGFLGNPPNLQDHPPSPPPATFWQTQLRMLHYCNTSAGANSANISSRCWVMITEASS
jgi:hypothetical protein